MGTALSKRIGVRLFLGVWIIYSVCPPFLSYDSYWTTATAVSLIENGTTAVDRFVPESPPESWYGLECVPTEGEARKLRASSGCPGGHWYSWYPIGTAILVTPLFLAMKAVLALVGPLIPRTGFFQLDVVDAFLSGDLLHGRPFTELWCASTIGVLIVWMQYKIARFFLDIRSSAAVAMVFAFGTSEWSVASRNLFPHGISLLLLSSALYCLLRAKENPRWLRWTAMCLALAFTVRPSNAIPCLAITAYVIVHQRRYLGQFLLWATPVAILYFGYYLSVRHTLQPLYVKNAIIYYPPVKGLAMHLFSPSRGLFVFTPFLLASVAGAVIAWRRRWLFPLAPYLMAAVIAHFALISFGWPGHEYGPRFTTDILYLFLLFLIPVIERWRAMQGSARRALAGLFVAMVAWSVFVHARGATSLAVHQWNVIPVNIDEAKERVWDWSDPQFLRGLR